MRKTKLEIDPEQRDSDESETAEPKLGTVLIVEPQALLLWSLTAFLGRWFDVRAADSQMVAQQLLASYDIHAVVVSDDLPGQGGDEIESLARSRYPGVRVVRTLSRPSRVIAIVPPTLGIEKPFTLSHLADLLGVYDESRDAGPR